MSDTDDTIASARAAYERITGARYDVVPTRRRSRGGGLRKRVTRIAVADAAILLAATVIGLFIPLGMFGALAVMALLIAATVALAIYPQDVALPPERLRQADLRTLPAQTGRWLDSQRAALPAPAVMVADRIGVRLDTLGVQLAALDDDTPAAGEIRRLVGEQLPEFVRDYQRVPREMRGVPRNGKTPDRQLVDGLEVIEREIGQMSEQLAQGDLDSLATRSRYLEIKYSGEG
ncbi:hypothetical protein M0208_03320 [Sphingomonas sp. SUN019]|uniref:hypothetical protein n=1 Tax=Sphingomonas sp. SUN019 TaxID=2937788 RepID=UPI0021647818|nr:hypothetical protein [Sphingomonas sp. SUN019]UVO49588.1 hypothetical protein M0208_03320 [Sphingomonas sp. SUN019]